eukprot:6285316-Prymnesium_polylepis.1
MGRGRVGCARRCAWPWMLRYCATSAFVRSLGVREQRACGVLGAVALCEQAVLWAAVHCACAVFAW